MRKLVGVSLAIIMILGSVTLSFATLGSSSDKTDASWYVGEGLKSGDYFEYSLCHIDLNDCAPIKMKMWIKGDIQHEVETLWDAKVTIFDGNKITVGSMGLGKISPEPITFDDDLFPYAMAFKSSLGWLSAFTSPLDEGFFGPTDFSHNSFQRICEPGCPQPTPIGSETISIPAGTFDTEVIRWGEMSGNASNIWIVDDFPFPVKALVFEFFSFDDIEKQYEFELLYYKENVQSNPFEDIKINYFPTLTPVLSLKQQLESGVAPENIQCRENLALVLRINGNLACVSEKTAQKMNWKIIHDLVTNDGNEPVNYWLPIPADEREDFAQKFATAANISLTGVVNKDGDYKTEPFGWLTIGDTVIYRSYEMGIDATQTEKFVRDFMDSMGFEYDEENFHLQEGPIYRDGSLDDYQLYRINTGYSFIDFEFYHKYRTTFEITFTGWTNNPELIIFNISKTEALQYAEEFSKDLEGNLNLLYGEYPCGELQKELNPKYPLQIFVNKKVISGIPYYVSEVGICVHSNDTFNFYEAASLGMFSHLLLHQDAVNGTDIFILNGPSGE